MKQQPMVSNAWQFYSYTYGEGMRAIIRFDVTAAQEETHQGCPFGERVLVFLPPDVLYPNGTPKQSVFETLADFEENLIAKLEQAGVPCRFVGVMTYSGLRDFIFQVADREKFDQALKDFLKEAPFRTERRSYPDWSFFDDKVAPKPHFWRQISDRQVIEELVAAGSDPHKKHTLEHVFTGPQDRLVKFLGTLTSQGFRKKTLTENRLEVQIDYPLTDPEMIFRMTAYLWDHSQKFGLKYDGWGAAVRK